MSNRSETAEAIIGLLGDRPVAYHPALAKLLGGVKQAIFVSQLLYWHDKGARSDGFIWKTQAEFTEETGLSRYEQETARSHLRKLGVLEEAKHGIPAKLHYRLDTAKLADLIAEIPHTRMRKPRIQGCGDPTDKDAETPQRITETTSESTSENTTETQEAGTPPPSPSGDPSTFTSGEDWVKYVQSLPKKHKLGALMRMYCTLYRGRDPPDWGFLGTFMNRAGAGYAAELLWRHCVRPPSGCPIKYLMGVLRRQAVKRGSVEELDKRRLRGVEKYGIEH